MHHWIITSNTSKGLHSSVLDITWSDTKTTSEMNNKIDPNYTWFTIFCHVLWRQYVWDLSKVSKIYNSMLFCLFVLTVDVSKLPSVCIYSSECNLFCSNNTLYFFVFIKMHIIRRQMSLMQIYGGIGKGFIGQLIVAQPTDCLNV